MLHVKIIIINENELEEFLSVQIFYSQFKGLNENILDGLNWILMTVMCFIVVGVAR